MPENQIVLSSQEQTLLEALLNQKISINHSCGGYGSCGTCLVNIRGTSQRLPDRNEVESEMAIDRSFKDYERLSCQLEEFGDLIIEIANRDRLNDSI